MIRATHAKETARKINLDFINKAIEQLDKSITDASESGKLRVGIQVHEIDHYVHIHSFIFDNYKELGYNISEIKKYNTPTMLEIDWSNSE